MSAPASDDNSTDGRVALAAGLAGPQVDTVFQLEKAANTIGVHVVGDRRAAQADGVLKNQDQGLAEPFKLGAGQPAGLTAGPNTSPEEAFVGIDVAHAGQQSLVEQGGFDGQLASPKQAGEGLGADGERLLSGTRKAGGAVQVAQLEAAKTARVYKSDLAATLEEQAGVGMWGERALRRGDKEAPGHAQVDDPLRGWSGSNLLHKAAARSARTQFADNVLAGAMNGENDASLKAFGLTGRRGFEGFAMAAEPGLDDLVAANPRVHATGDGFNLRQLGHPPIVEEEARLSEILGQAVAFNGGALLGQAHLAGAPFLQVHETQAETHYKDADR